MSTRPATFDIVNFCANAKTLGATEVVFDTSKGFQAKKFSPEIAEMMYRNVLIPVALEFGFSVSEGIEGDFTCGQRWDDCFETFREKRRMSILQYGGERSGVSVTIRDSIRNTHRNSNTSAWRRFADDVGAIVIDDAYKVQISIKDRLAIYRKCRMNYFCSNGPGVLCMFSNLPYAFFSPDSAKGTWTSTLNRFQMPWATENQKIIWQNDSYENIKNQQRGGR